MTTNTLRNLVASCFRNGKQGKGVLTSDKANHYNKDFGSLVSISSQQYKVFFFSDNHLFGYPHMPADFVPCSSSLPMRVTPRESLPTGIILTVEDYTDIFYNGFRQINSIEELANFIDAISNQ